MRKITAAAVALGVTGVTLVGLAGAAGATHSGDTRAADAAHIAGGEAARSGSGAGSGSPTAANGTIKLPTTSYTSPTNQSIPVHALSPGTAVQTLCFTEGQTLNNNFYWFRILHNGDLGFVHRDAIAPPAELRHC